MTVQDYDIQLVEEYSPVADRCFAKLSQSPTARLMIEDAKRRGWSVLIDDREPYDFHIDVQNRVIILNNYSLSAGSLLASGHFQNALLLSLVRALRDVWQEMRHGSFADQYEPEQVLVLERVRAADSDVVAVLVAWELRAEGFSDLWRHLIGSDEGDLAMVFSAQMERADTYGISVHEAMRATFNQWFEDASRVRICDHETLDYMDSLMDEYEYADLFGAESLHPLGVEVISCLPDKTAYLAGMGQEIMIDPFYSSLDDEINTVHFTQILHDLRATYVEGVPFRDQALAAKIFPDSFLLSDA